MGYTLQEKEEKKEEFFGGGGEKTKIGSGMKRLLMLH